MILMKVVTELVDSGSRKLSRLFVQKSMIRSRAWNESDGLKLHHQVYIGLRLI